MQLVAALVYWVIVVIWAAVLITLVIAVIRKKVAIGTTKLLLVVVAIDTARNIIENLYFGAYFGSQYGLLPSNIAPVLAQPSLLILPKVLNIVAAGTVLFLLLFKWLPMNLREKAKAQAVMRHTSQALRREVEEHRRLFDTSVDLIVVLDRDRLIRRISRSCTTILGYEPSEVMDRYGGDFVFTDDVSILRGEMEKAVMDSESAVRNFECRFRHRDGHLVSIEVSAVWSSEVERFFLTGRDLTAAREASRNLKRLAEFDQLTKLPNRSSLGRDVEANFKQGASRSMAVAMFDLDGFKDVNDSLGHALGDELLKSIPERLARLLPEEASLYRIGGDEFSMVLVGAGDPIIVTQIIEKMLRRLQEPFAIGDHRVVVGASAGVAFAPAHADSASELLANADLALYAAKADGRRKIRMFTPMMRSSAHGRIEIDQELQRATHNREFVLHFQPQYRLEDGAMIGVEALLRWKHPDRGLLSPGCFIDALADSPYANEIGDWILEQACRSAAKWRGMGRPVRIAVNLFASQFVDGRIVSLVRQTLERANLPPEMLELEITENIVLGNEAILASLRTLRSEGVHIAFDDFGTGYASLSCVEAFPLTRLKIDRSFVRNIEEASSKRDTAIAASMISLAHNLGLSVTAEGVETAAQEAFLRGKGCDEVQGFRYARPMPLDQLEAELKKQPRSWVRLAPAVRA